MGKWTPTRDFYIPKGSRKVADKGSDAVAYLYTNERRAMPGACVFFGKQAKPVWDFIFKSEDRREAKIRETFADRGRRVRVFRASRTNRLTLSGHRALMASGAHAHGRKSRCAK